MATKKRNGMINADDRREWYLNGQLHREDGPAVEWANGSREWYLNGKRHREDGPAIEWADGDREWYLNGKRHREDGPAVEEADGNREWWLKDKEIDGIRSLLDFRKKIDNFGVEGLIQKQDIKEIERKKSTFKKEIIEKLGMMFNDGHEFTEKQWLEIHREALISHVHRS